MSFDIIYIRDLRVDTQVGLYSWERHIKQVVNLNLDLLVDIQKAAKSMMLADTIDYAKLAKSVSEFITQKNFLLLETLAEQVADFILKEFHVRGVRIQVSKPGALAKAKEVGVIITRGEWVA